jgi:hypothetical protein
VKVRKRGGKCRWREVGGMEGRKSGRERIWREDEGVGCGGHGVMGEEGPSRQ